MSEDNSWVFDSLVCFLHGPVWNAPLQTFIEEKSLLFDPNQEMDENPQIMEIHNDYKNLVDYMLGSFMEELHITPEQFELACTANGSPQQPFDGHQGNGNVFQFHQGLFQQIWAANDVKIFIRMMTQRNVELQLQALDLIEKNQSGFLQEAIGAGETLAADTDTRTPSPSERAGNVDGEDLSQSTDRERPTSPDATVTPELEDLPTDQSVDEVAEKLERLNLFFEKNQVPPEEIVSRQKYLQQQRDRLIEIKRKTRVKKLAESMAHDPDIKDDKSQELSLSALSSGSGQRRPTSAAQAACQLLDKPSAKSLTQLMQQPEEQVALNSALQVRKTLAKRLKTEVVEQES